MLLVLAVVAVALLWRPGVRRVLSAQRIRYPLSTAFTALLVVVFVVLLSRPLWNVGHGPLNNIVAAWQREAGVAVDGTRTYNERTLYWLGEYLGWPTVVLAIPGYALWLRGFFRHRDYALLATLSMGLSMSALYLWNSEITPDQPWAIRRYVPVIIPILVIAAAAGIGLLWQHRDRWSRAAAVLASVIAVGFPLFVAAHLWNVREEYGQYAQVQAICRAMGDDGAVVEVDYPAMMAYGQTMRSYCGVPSTGFVGATQLELARMSAAATAHHRTLFVMAQNASALPFVAGSSTAPFSDVTTKAWPHFIGGPPVHTGARRTPIFLGRVGADGLVTPVTP